MVGSVAAPASFSWDVRSDHRPTAYDEYRDSFDGLYEVAEPDLGPDGTFFNRTRMTMFGGGVIGHGRSNGQTLRRSDAQARRAGFDSISLILAYSPAAGRAGERSFACRPGSILFLDLARPSESRWSGLDVINLVVPRDQLPIWLSGADLHGLSLAPGDPAARLIASHLSAFAEVAAQLTEAQGETALNAALLLADRALAGAPASAPAQKAALYRAVREAANRYLETRILDPRLNADRIARACAVSRATLYRAFEDQGGVVRHLQRRRLDLAREALARRIDGMPAIADIAAAHGFSSPAHFSRAFRDRFGMPPSDVTPLDRRSAMAGENMIAHAAVVDWLSRA